MGEEPLEAFLRDDLGTLSPILDSIPLGIIVIDAAGACVYLNHECTSITGYTLEDARADRAVCREICSGLVDRAPVEGPHGPWGKMATEQESLIRCKDGRIRRVRLRAISITNDRAIVTLLPWRAAGPAEESLFERRELYRALIENMNDAVLVLDTNARVIAYNQAFLLLFGFEGKDVERAFVGLRGQSREGKELLEKMLPAMETLRTFRTEWDFRGKDGRVMRLESSTAPIVGPDDVVTGYVSSMRPVKGEKERDSWSVR